VLFFHLFFFEEEEEGRKVELVGDSGEVVRRWPPVGEGREGENGGPFQLGDGAMGLSRSLWAKMNTLRSQKPIFFYFSNFLWLPAHFTFVFSTISSFTCTRWMSLLFKFFPVRFHLRFEKF
jgi:hypothetical protein